MDTHKTKVVFRKYKDGDTIALFPGLSYARNYMTDSYIHVGQHGECDYHHVIRRTRPASPEEYKDLYQELEIIGYNMLIRQRASITYRRD